MVTAVDALVGGWARTCHAAGRSNDGARVCQHQNSGRWKRIYPSNIHDHRSGVAGNRLDRSIGRRGDERIGSDRCRDDTDVGWSMVPGQAICADDVSQTGMGLARLVDRGYIDKRTSNLYVSQPGVEPRNTIL